MGYVGKVTADGTTHLVGSTLYGTCSTAAATVAKVVTCSDFTTLITGVTIHVKFTETNTATNPTLNVNSTGAKAIKMYGTTAVGANTNSAWYAGAIVSFTYDGTNWLMNDHRTNTDTNTKVTSVGNHYAPAADTSAELSASATGATAAWSIDVVQGVQLQRDAKGHVTGVTVTSGKVPANPNTDTKVTVTNTNPTSGTWYYPTWYTATSGTGGVNVNDGLQYYSLQGTAETAGDTILKIGNSTATGTAGNKVGYIRIYGKNTRYAQIAAPDAASGNRTHTLPGTAGTILNTGTTSFTQSLSSGTKIGSIKINGTSTDIYCETNTDANVTQTETTSGSYDILMSNNDSSDTTTYTSGVRKSNKLSFNISTGELEITNGNVTTEGYTSICRHISSDPSYFISRSPNGAKLDLIKNNSSGGVVKQLTATEEDITLIGTGNTWDGTNTSLKSALGDKANNSRIIAQPWVDVTSTNAGFVDVTLPSGVTVVSGSLSHAPAITPYYRSATYGYSVTCYALANNKLRVYMYNGVSGTALPANTAVALSILWYKG